jgi:hypothetical protein
MPGEVNEGYSGVFKWKLYSIENYLVEGDALFQLVKDGIRKTKLSSRRFNAELKEIAREQIGFLVTHRMCDTIWRELAPCLSLGDKWRARPLSEYILGQLEASQQRIKETILTKFDMAALTALEKETSEAVENAFQTDAWRCIVPGRLILKAVKQRFLRKLDYEQFVGLAVSKMRDSGFKRAGMKQVIDDVLLAS